MNKLLIFFIAFLILPLGGAWSNTTFNNSLGSERLGFTENQNITRYIQIPQGAYLTTARLNLSGYQNGPTCYQEFVNATSECPDLNIGKYYINTYTGYAAWTNQNNIYDGNWSTWGISAAPATGSSLTINYTLPNNFLNATLSYAIDGASGNLSIPINCIDTSKNLSIRFNSGVSGSFSCYNYSSNLYYILVTGTNKLYEERIIWGINATNWTTNVNISVNNTQIFYNPNNYTGVNNRTNNFASIINDYLGLCNYTNSSCSVPIIFHSDNKGIIEYSNLVINNSEYIIDYSYNESSVFETNITSFRINISYDKSFYSSVSASLIYNNTAYSTTKTTTSIGDNFLVNLDVPTKINDGEELQNYTFYWRFTFLQSDGITNNIFNTTFYNQTVKRILLNNCSSPSLLKAYNFSAWDESTGSRIPMIHYRNNL